MNIELLEAIALKLQRMRHASHFYMPKWSKETDCGTALCVGGTALVMQGYKLKKDNGSRFWQSEFDFLSPKTGRKVDPWCAAKRELRLTEKQGKLLFNLGYWPKQFLIKDGDDEETTTPKLGAARIRHFIATKGRE